MAGPESLLALAPPATVSTIAPTIASPMHQPATNAGPFVRPRGVTSIRTTATIGSGLIAPTPTAEGRKSPIAWPIRFVRVVITTASRCNRPNLRHDLRGSGMPKPFKGVINVEITDSVPDWEPYTQPTAPEAAGGVLFAHGSRFGGHALYIKDRKLKYVYNFAGLDEQVVESTIEVPTGHVVLSASFERDDGDSMPCAGTLTLHVREEEAGEAGSRRSRASSRSPAKGSTSAGRAPSPSPTTTRATTPGPSSAARSTRPPSTSAEQRSSTSRSRRERRSRSTDVRPARNMERRRGEDGDCRLRRASDDRGRAGLRPAGRADRRL